MPRKVAILVPGIELGGGVPAVGAFLHQRIQASGRYRAELISLAVSSRDAASTRLLSPSSWITGARVVPGVWQRVEFKHVGCHVSEVEVARYLPRAVLTRLLRDFDLIQVVAGTPVSAFAISFGNKPKCLSVATTILQDRGSALARSRGASRIWRRTMTAINVAMERSALRRMDHVFAQSEYTRTLLSDLVPDRKLSIAAPGVDTQLFSPGSYREDGYILSVARFSDPRKNIRMLFRAYALLRRKSVKAPPLVLAGSHGPSDEDWGVALELGIMKWTEFRENPSIDELAKLYRGASVFALSSNEEGFGIVLTEAMASGLPVVSTRCGGPESVVDDGETGYLTPVGDYEAMAERLSELLEDLPKRTSMGKEGRRVAEERFSLEATGRAYVDVYDRLLG